MTTATVYLSSPERVQEFVAVLTDLDGNFDLVSGNYILDAKSLMGIFTFDLSGPLTLNVYNDTPENMKAIEPFTKSGAGQ